MERARSDNADVDAARDLAHESWEQALLFPERADELSRTAEALAPDDPLVQARVLRNRAYRGLFVGEITDAMRMAEEAEARFSALGHDADLATALDIQSHVYEFTGDFGRAIDRSSTSLRVAERAGDKRQTGWAYANLGSIELSTGDQGKAEDYFQKALRVFRELGYRPGESRILGRLGEIALARGDDEAAFRYEQESMALGRQLGLTFLVARSHQHLGRLWRSRGDLSEARASYEAALGEWQSVGMRPGIGEALFLLAELELEEGRPAVATGLLERAKAEFEGRGEYVLLYEIEELYSRALEETGKLTEALQAARAAHRLERRVFDSDSRLKLRKVQTRLEVERAERDAEIHRLKYVELKAMQGQLVESEKMATLGRLAAGVAHEVKTPAGILKSHGQLTRRLLERLRSHLGSTPDVERWMASLADSLASADAATDRIVGIVNDLQEFASVDRSEFREADLVHAFRNVLRLVRPRLPPDVEVEESFAPLPRFQGHVGALQQALSSMLLYASEHACCPGKLHVFSDREDNALVLGIGFVGSPDLPGDEVFELGFEDGPSTVQFRLGLPTARSTARKHGGELSWQDRGGCKALVLTLPEVGPGQPLASGEFTIPAVAPRTTTR